MPHRAACGQAHPGAAVAFFETNMIAGPQGPAFTNTWHTPDSNKRVAAAQSAEECSGPMRESGARFFVARIHFGNLPSRETAPATRAGAGRCARVSGKIR